MLSIEKNLLRIEDIIPPENMYRENVRLIIMISESLRPVLSPISIDSCEIGKPKMENSTSPLGMIMDVKRVMAIRAM